MTLVESILNQDADFFLVRATPESAAEITETPDMNQGIIDGLSAATKADLMEEVYVKLQFPEYFGRNWDAFYDSFTEMLWDLDHTTYLLSFTSANSLLSKEPDQEIDTLIQVLKSAIDDVAREDCGVSLKIVFMLEDIDNNRFRAAIASQQLSYYNLP